MTAGKPIFVAETDEQGRVAWVWRVESDRQRARPVGDPKRHLAELTAARFSGAPPLSIIEWLTARADKTPAA